MSIYHLPLLPRERERERESVTKTISSFTLIELLIVVAIIGILAALIIVSLNTVLPKARDAQRLSDLHEIATGLAMYYTNNQAYPDGPSLQTWSTHADWPNILSTQYIAHMPIDPLNIDLGNCEVQLNCHVYTYCVYNNGQNFTLGVNLENPANPPMNANPSCAFGGPNYYWVSK